MTFKINSRVVLGLAALAAGVLISDWALAQAAAPAAPAPAAAAAPTFNKGDNAWMLTASVLVLLMTIPGLALFYGGMVRSKNMLSVLMHVFYTVCIVTLIWVIYGYSLAFTGGGPYVGGLSKLFLAGVNADSQAATFSAGVDHPRVHLHLLPDDLRRDYPGADRRCLRRTHQVLGGGAVHPVVGDVRLLPDRAHGLVLGRSGCDRRRGRPNSPRLQPVRPRRPRRPSSTQRWPTRVKCSCGARSTSPAAPSCISTQASPVSSVRS